MSNTNEFVIDTELNTDEAVSSAKDLVKHMKFVAQTVSNVQKTTKVAFRQVISELDSASKAYDRQKAKVDELQKKYDAMDKVTISKDYQKELEKEAKLEEKKNDLLAKAKMIEKSNKSNKSKANALENIRQQIELLEKQKAAQADVLEFMRLNGEQYDRSKSTAAESQLNEEKAKLSSLADTVREKAVAATDAEKQVEEESNHTESRLSRIATTAKRVGSTVAHAFGRTVKGAISGVSKGLNALHKALHKSNGGLNKGFRNILKYAFGIQSVFVLLNRLKTAIKEGMNNLAQADDTTNKSLSTLKSSLTQLKNSFATAFAPIVNIVAPILASFVNQISQVVTAIGMVIAALGGANTFKKAIAVQEDYAASLNKSGKAAKGLLSPLDDLNKEAEDSASGVSPSDMFEEVDISEGASNIADKLKSMFELGDFSNLGGAIGSKLADSLDTLGEKWPSIKEKAEKIGTSIGTFINGFIEVPELGKKIGSNIGEAVNTGLSTAHGFVSSLHWASLGKFVADGLNNMLNTIDWKTASNTFGKGFGGIIEGAKTFLINFDWRGFANNIATFFKNIDWAYVVSQIASAFGAALGGLAAFLHETLINVGNAIHEGFKDGIIEGFKNIGQWILDNIFKPFIDAFKAAFGIHSPSTVMKEQGGFLMAGLFNGISENIKPILEKFTFIKTEIVKTVTSIKTSVCDLWMQMWNGVKGTINVFISGVERFCNSLISAINTVFNWLNKLHIDVPDWVSNKFGINSFGFNLPTMSSVSIPRLATGTVVPRQSKEFAAILGDNNRETEVVSPLSTMKQAFIEAMSETGGNGGGTYNFTAMINRRTLFEEMITEAQLRQNATGRNPFELA